jgi:Zn-dependent membrane protease YugP
MMFDPLYTLVLGVGFVLSLAAQIWVKSSVHRWSQIAVRSGFTGRDVAAAILQAERIGDVRIEPVSGFLSDHYSPSERVLRLSEDIFYGRSVAAVGIAAHEVGHAIQHKHGYWPMQIRQTLVPVANIGTHLGVWLVVLGLAMGLTELASLGVILFGGFVAFTLITLPVEFDASFRAREVLLRNGIITAQEARGVSEVLTAAAATYLAAAVSAILQFLYWSLRAGLFGRRDDSER